jgi:hypothetical protein
MRLSFPAVLLSLALASCGDHIQAGPATAPAAARPLATAPVMAAFDADAIDQPPAGFTVHTIGPGRPSRWVVKAVADAPSGRQVLMQADDDETNHRYPCVLATAGRFGDVRVAVRGKGISGNRDRSFGVIVRAVDERNYMVARCNTVNENVRLYRFVDGVRKELAEWEGSAAPGVWHQLAIEARGSHFTVFFNGAKVIDCDDPTFPAPGLVGMWTKAEAVSQFDDFSATPLP